MLRENKRMLDKAIRDLDRERMALQNQEKKLIVEIKKTAKQGQMARPSPAGPPGARPKLAAWASAPDPRACAGAQDAVKVMAKSLVRNRHAVIKMYGLKSQLQAVSLRIAVRPAAPPCDIGCLPSLTPRVSARAPDRARRRADAEVHAGDG